MFSTRLYSEVAASGSVTDDNCCRQPDSSEGRKHTALCALQPPVTSRVQSTDILRPCALVLVPHVPSCSNQGTSGTLAVLSLSRSQDRTSRNPLWAFAPGKAPGRCSTCDTPGHHLAARSCRSHVSEWASRRKLTQAADHVSAPRRG